MGTNGIKCGRCNRYHTSVRDVRRCFNGETVDLVNRVMIMAEMPDAAIAEMQGSPDAPAFVTPTDKQMKYVKDLLNKNNLLYVPGLQTLAKRQVSEVISILTHPSGEVDGRFRTAELPAYCANGACPQDAAWVKSGVHGGRETILCDDHKRSAQAADFNNRFMYTRLTDPVAADLRRPTHDPVPASSPAAPEKAPAFDPETLEDGFYALPGEDSKGLPKVYKVIVAIHGSGRKYAKLLNTETGVWDMAQGAVRTLRPEMRMTLSQALEVAKVVATDVNGALYGRCFKCGRPLTAEDSIERMMGPVCAESFS